MKIPINILKEWVSNMESLEINELDINISSDNELPETYCLFISKKPCLVGIEAKEPTTPRYIEASFKLQDRSTATLVLNIN